MISFAGCATPIAIDALFRHVADRRRADPGSRDVASTAPRRDGLRCTDIHQRLDADRIRVGTIDQIADTTADSRYPRGNTYRFNRYVGESFVLIPVVAAHFRSAEMFANRYETGLRAGDALHLAVAASIGATVFTLDQTMATAGPMLGVPTRLV